MVLDDSPCVLCGLTGWWGGRLADGRRHGLQSETGERDMHSSVARQSGTAEWRGMDARQSGTAEMHERAGSQRVGCDDVPMPCLSRLLAMRAMLWDGAYGKTILLVGVLTRAGRRGCSHPRSTSPWRSIQQCGSCEGRTTRGDQGHLMLGEHTVPPSEVIRAMLLDDSEKYPTMWQLRAPHNMDCPLTRWR